MSAIALGFVCLLGITFFVWMFAVVIVTLLEEKRDPIMDWQWRHRGYLFLAISVVGAAGLITLGIMTLRGY